MEINFKTNKLSKLCSNPSKLVKEHGKRCADSIITALMEMLDAPSMADLPPNRRPHPLTGNFKGCYALDVSKAKRIVFRPVDDPLPTHEDGSVDITRVEIVCIEYIGDYHD